MRWAMTTVLAYIGVTLAAGAEGPATQPATGAMLNGQIEYAPPSGWKTVKSDVPGDLQVVYLADDQDGFFRLMVLPENAAIDANAAKQYAANLRANHKNANQEMVQPPEIEKDARFAIKIHERYKNKEGKIVDETYIYRQVNSRAMEIQVQSLSPDVAHVSGVHKTAEDVILSAHWKGGPAATQAAIATLLNGRIEFNAPPTPWVKGKVANSSDDSAVNFGIGEEERWLMLRVLPPNAAITPKAGTEMVISLRGRHKKSNEEIVDTPTVEKDARFAIRIHERYREKGGKLVDETHLFMQVAGRAMELDIHTVSNDAADLAADRKAGEDILVSTHWKRPRPVKKP